MDTSSPTPAASDPSDTAPPLEPTGVPGLDLVLGGGLPYAAPTLIVGPPGSGKTTLACQIAFAAAGRGQQVLLLTALSEPPLRLLAHLRTYRFYVPDFIGTQVQVYTAEQFFSLGEAPPVQQLVADVRRTGARWVVIDGFQGLREEDPEPQRTRQVLHSLGSQLSMLGVTTLLACEGDHRAPTPVPEMTTADVVLGLSFPLLGVQTPRGLEVLKVRGQAPLLGRHSLTVSEQGVTVFPRLETQVTGASHQVQPSPAPGTRAPLERVDFGLPELDGLLGGGLTANTSTVLAGSLGTGKTLLALAFALAGVRRGELVLWLSFRESAEHLMQKADPFQWGPACRAALTTDGGVRVQRWTPVELDPDQVASELLLAVRRTGARRVIIDTVAELEWAVLRTSGAQRLPDYLAALLEALRQEGVTLLALKETPKVLTTELDFTTEPVGVLAENSIQLQQLVRQGQILRVLSVLKMGFSGYEAALREVRIAAPVGFEVLRLAESGGELATEQARQQGTPGAGEPRTSPGTPSALSADGLGAIPPEAQASSSQTGAV